MHDIDLVERFFFLCLKETKNVKICEMIIKLITVIILIIYLKNNSTYFQDTFIALFDISSVFILFLQMLSLVLENILMLTVLIMLKSFKKKFFK